MNKSITIAKLVLLFSIVPALYLVPKWLIDGTLIQDTIRDTIYTIAGVTFATYGAFFGSIAYLYRSYKKHNKK